MNHINYPKIRQFRDIVKQVKEDTYFQGMSEDDPTMPVFNYNAPLPTIPFLGTVKMHGTNAGIQLDVQTGEIQAQSRAKMLTPLQDNAGFAYWVEAHKAEIRPIFDELLDWFPAETIVIYGEWCGGNIQKRVALNGLDKMFVIFDIKVDDEWVQVFENLPRSENIKFITDYPKFFVNIDFENPAAAIENMVKLTEAVEAQCPVGAAHGQDGIGEGIVWKAAGVNDTSRYVFKVKGEKHTSSKQAKKLVTLDPVKLKNIEEFVDYAVTESRLEQGLTEMYGPDYRPDMLTIKDMGKYIKWVNNDVLSEESDVLKLVEVQLEPKDVVKAMSTMSRNYFQYRLTSDY